MIYMECILLMKNIFFQCFEFLTYGKDKFSQIKKRQKYTVFLLPNLITFLRINMYQDNFPSQI